MGESLAHHMLLLRIKDRKSLHAAYMPFLKNGGLFVPTTQEYQLGEDTLVLLDLLDGPEKIPVVGKVVWVTPAHARTTRGLGIEFNQEESASLRQKIEAHLADYMSNQKQTHTL